MKRNAILGQQRGPSFRAPQGRDERCPAALSTYKKACHLERSAAESKDLRLPLSLLFPVSFRHGLIDDQDPPAGHADAKLPQRRPILPFPKKRPPNRPPPLGAFLLLRRNGPTPQETALSPGIANGPAPCTPRRGG